MLDPVDDETLEMWSAQVAATDEGRPGLVGIHGGAFMAEFDRSLHRPLARAG